ncbi:uncharacterized protein LOC109545491 [Dendroctonus ponderosae]
MFASKIFNLNVIKTVTPIIRRCLNVQSHQIPKAHFTPLANYWIYQQNDKIKTPPTISNSIDLPNGLTWVPPLIEPAGILDEIIAPSTETSETPKEAHRMLIIRRKKMKKHKLKKLRKRMKFVYAKRRQRREMKKEKAFQAVLITQCKEAEKFSAEQYVEDKLNKLHEIVIPRYWKGKKYPEFIIRQKMGLPPK